MARTAVNLCPNLAQFCPVWDSRVMFGRVSLSWLFCILVITDANANANTNATVAAGATTVNLCHCLVQYSPV